jgi:hypothetical protein
MTESFLRDLRGLTPPQRQAFRRAVQHFIQDLRGGAFRGGLRVKGIQGMPGCFEMTWAGDGRAIFAYGPEVLPGERHVVWLAVGTHSILP